MTFEERVAGCLKGLATGDAIGKQTETLTRDQVRKWYPQGITGFCGNAGDTIPRYSGKRYGWRIGETTDDTEQTLAVVRAIVTQGRVKHTSVGRELLRCKKSVHPGVSLWRFLQLGDPAHVAAEGDGCGAAMRSAPVGVICRSHELEELVEAAYECSIPTHGGQIGICAAVAVAAAVSAAVEGRPSTEVLRVAVEASKRAEAYRPSRERRSIARAIDEVYSDLNGKKQRSVQDVAERYLPDKTENIIGLAIGLALVTQSAEETALFAANLGGDADSVASMGGAIAGALRPESVNEDWFRIVSAVNEEDISGAATALAGIAMNSSPGCLSRLRRKRQPQWPD